MVNNREELIEAIRKSPKNKFKGTLLRFAKAGVLDAVIGKTDDELIDICFRIIRNPFGDCEKEQSE